eukprot:Opistho-1_new@84544
MDDTRQRQGRDKERTATGVPRSRAQDIVTQSRGTTAEHSGAVQSLKHGARKVLLVARVLKDGLGVFRGAAEEAGRKHHREVVVRHLGNRVVLGAANLPEKLDHVLNHLAVDGREGVEHAEVCFAAALLDALGVDVGGNERLLELAQPQLEKGAGHVRVIRLDVVVALFDLELERGDGVHVTGHPENALRLFSAETKHRVCKHRHHLWERELRVKVLLQLHDVVQRHVEHRRIERRNHRPLHFGKRGHANARARLAHLRELLHRILCERDDLKVGVAVVLLNVVAEVRLEVPRRREHGHAERNEDPALAVAVDALVVRRLLDQLDKDLVADFGIQKALLEHAQRELRGRRKVLRQRAVAHKRLHDLKVLHGVLRHVLVLWVRGHDENGRGDRLLCPLQHRLHRHLPSEKPPLVHAEKLGRITVHLERGNVLLECLGHGVRPICASLSHFQGRDAPLRSTQR